MTHFEINIYIYVYILTVAKNNADIPYVPRFTFGVSDELSFFESVFHSHEIHI